ncbi:MAG TPA: PAS domain S-box protein [Polyangiaceae bacterium]|nr:PAS domain S-box protein [Polyangiaceae bacterium]
MSSEHDAHAKPEHWYRQALETAPDAMVIAGLDEKIVFANLQAQHLFGYDRDELIGQSLEVLVPTRFRANHSKQVSRFFMHPGARPMGSGLELFGRRKDGSEIPIEVSLSPLHTEKGALVSAAIRDISERRRTEAIARQAGERLSNAVESIQDALALFDANDRVVLCNSAYRRLIGPLLPGSLLGRPYDEVLEAWIGALEFPSDAAREAFRTERLAARKQPSATFDVRMRDGRHLRVVDRQTADGGLVKTIWDLTEDVRLANELAAARATAEAASAAKSEFLSSMSHELRTPLNAILGFAQLLRRDKREPLSERHRERAEQILRGGEHLLRLIDDILDLSRIEAGAVSMSVEPVNVDDVLNEVRMTLEPMAARAGLSLSIRRSDSPLPMIAADRTRFAQILMNFGSNAIKYNRPGGSVTLTISTRPSHFVRVAVADTGLGIPVEKQGKLFQPFQRAGQETGPIEGTGIGLVITKRLAELMRGTVGFCSTEGQGSEFWVEIPVHSGAGLLVRGREASAGPSTSLSDDRQRLVLYVEDNPANILFMTDLLGNFDGIQLITAPTAEMGVELARVRRPDAIVMDINLPGMSGLDALHALKEIDETKGIPVIALTAAASERDKQRGSQAGFFRYLTKPVRVDEFEAALEAVFDSHS